MDYEGDIDSEEELEEAFQTLTIDLVDISPTTDTKLDVDHFYTTVGQVKTYEAILIAETLANKAFSYSMLTEDVAPYMSDQDPFSYTIETTSRYTSAQFQGIMVDTRASKRSTGGYGQFLTLQKQDSAVQLNIATQGIVNVQFGIGSTSLISSARVSIPIGTVEFHIVKVNTPFLLCLADIDNLQVYFNNLKNLLIILRDAILVVRRYGHPFLL